MHTHNTYGRMRMDMQTTRVNITYRARVCMARAFRQTGRKVQKSEIYTRFKTGCVYRGQSKRRSGSNAYQNVLFWAFQNDEAKRVSKRPCVYRGLQIF